MEIQQETPNLNTNGGYRPNAGRKPGSRNKKTLEQRKIKELLDQRYMRATARIANAQIHIAIGQTFLYKIEKELIIGPKGGKSYRKLPPKLVTEQWEIESYLNGIVEGDIDDPNDSNATYYFLTTKEPNNMAIDSIINRVHGKPKESIEHTGEVKFSLRGLAEHRNRIESGDIELLDDPEQEKDVEEVIHDVDHEDVEIIEIVDNDKTDE